MMVVAKDSHALRSVPLLINNKEEVDSVIGPGSQIVAMSEEVCHQLALTYDPNIKLNMQSANGSIDQSLGLAHNVPCKLSPITLYLQIHIICNPTYDILLGQPFDVLTESTVQKF